MVVMTLMIVVMLMVMTMMFCIFCVQHPDAQSIDYEPNNCDKNGLIKSNCNRNQKAPARLDNHVKARASKKDGTGIGRQDAEFPGSKTKLG